MPWSLSPHFSRFTFFSRGGDTPNKGGPFNPAGESCRHLQTPIKMRASHLARIVTKVEQNAAEWIPFATHDPLHSFKASAHIRQCHPQPQVRVRIHEREFCSGRSFGGCHLFLFLSVVPCSALRLLMCAARSQLSKALMSEEGSRGRA